MDRRLKRFALAAWLAAAGAPALAQGGDGTSSSPFAPGDLKRPIFDTAKPVYETEGQQTRSAKTVVADVDGRAITLGQVADVVAELPLNVRSLPFADLFPGIVDQLVRQQALVIRAQRSALDEDPEVRRKAQAAADRVLANAALEKESSNSVTEAALLDRYDRDVAGKPGTDEVRVWVIMTNTEQAAIDIIGELRGGADFAAVARRSSKDSTALAGGDVGFVVRDQLTPEVGAVVFALAPGQLTSFPVRSAGAWFVLKVDERRHRPTPGFSAVREDLRRKMLRERAADIITAALGDVTVREFNIDGKETTASAANAGARGETNTAQ